MKLTSSYIQLHLLPPRSTSCDNRINAAALRPATWGFAFANGNAGDHAVASTWPSTLVIPSPHSHLLQHRIVPPPSSSFVPRRHPHLVAIHTSSCHGSFGVPCPQLIRRGASGKVVGAPGDPSAERCPRSHASRSAATDSADDYHRLLLPTRVREARFARCSFLAASASVMDLS